MAKPAIDFSAVTADAKAASEPIPVPNLKPATTETQGKKQEKQGIATIKGTAYHYSRIAIDVEVWQAMKYRKLIENESFTTQINKGMRTYLGMK